MLAPAHLGLEHPNLVWIVAAGLVAFVAGLGVNLYRSPRGTSSAPVADDPDAE